MTLPDSSEAAGIRRALKAAAATLFGRYRFNRIYRLTTAAVELAAPPGVSFQVLQGPPSAASADPELGERFLYGGHDSYGYGLFLDGCLAAVCWFWGSDRFKDPMLWVLGKNEAILVDLVVARRYRGRGLAPLLIRHASAEMRRTGWNLLYTWMWHTHRASYHAFERAGWRQIAWVVEIHPFGAARALRFCWRTLRNRAPTRPLVGDAPACVEAAALRSWTRPPAPRSASDAPDQPTHS